MKAKSETQVLTKEIENLRASFETHHSARRKFFTGVLFGLGSALGAGTIAGIVLYVVSLFIELTSIGL